VQVFGINDGESLSTTISFANNFGLTYPVLHDPTGSVYSSYSMSGLSPYPRDIIIDQNGIIQYMHTEYDPQYMLQTVNDLLGINDIENKKHEILPEKFNLQIYPNPFNPVTNVIFTVLESKPVNLEVFNVLGQKIYSNSYNNYHVGSKEKIQLNMINSPSGVYYLKLSNGKQFSTEKLILLR
jgi:type IX secretion system substrate protein/AhpC/TSA family protein